ncbi:MAG: hypothetical protein E6R07_13010 [Nevskiaceae bacterium]|nr:MAG: hypothetical protein E6R07_13010 [Nevskiaceae bacterium]
MRALPPALLAMLTLAGCAGGGDADPQTASVNPAALCVASSCGTKTQLLDIPSAENTLFTPDGRLFVSGSDSVYEITRDAAGWHATALAAGKANYTGLAQRGDTLYAAAFDGNLYAARLSDTPMAFKVIHALGVASPNGVTSGPDGALYIVNGPAGSSLPAPKILRLRFDPADPTKVIEQTDWLTSGLSFPNGLQRRGNTLVFSDSDAATVTFGAIRTVDIQADGSPGPVRTLGTFPSLPDDLGIVGDSVLAALYSNGQIALIDATGTIVSQTDPLSFQNPSSVKLGRPPLFAATDLVVTEKGLVVLPPTPGYGSKLSVFSRHP